MDNTVRPRPWRIPCGLASGSVTGREKKTTTLTLERVVLSGKLNTSINNPCPSDEFQIDHNWNMLQLPMGISSVTVTHPEPGQPIRIKLPLTEPNQNWCTICVNVPERMVTCPDSNLALSVQALKKTTVLAEQGKTVVRIPVTTQGEVQSFGVYAVPGLGTHAFVGPFTSRREVSSDNDDSSVGHCSETREFDENADESEPSCTPLCLVPCRQHMADSSTSEDSDKHHRSSQTSRKNDGIASHTRQQAKSSQTRWQAESENIRRSWKTRLMPENTTGMGPPCQNQRSRDGSNVWERSNRITTYITC
jgi:hypothetical protein